MFKQLFTYFDDEAFIIETSAVYFQRVLYALLNKKGYETSQICLKSDFFIEKLLNHLHLRPFAEITIRMILLDSCYAHMNFQIFLVFY